MCQGRGRDEAGPEFSHWTWPAEGLLLRLGSASSRTAFGQDILPTSCGAAKAARGVVVHTRG